MEKQIQTGWGLSGYSKWLIDLKYLMIGARIFTRHGKASPDRKAWKHFFDDGYTPLEAMLIDINEGGE